MKIIGMIHLDALPGYPQHKGMESVIQHALQDARALQEGGVDAILIENTDDDPHQKMVLPEIISAFTRVAQVVKDAVKLSIGICVLWNDYRASIAIAKIVGAEFVRIPVFTEAALTASGLIDADPYDAISYRNKLAANNIKILADVHVKHAAQLAHRPIELSSADALHFGADAIIITGKYTGDAPSVNDLQAVRRACPNAYILIGSGANNTNIVEMLKYADAAIVGTAFKTNGRIDSGKVSQLVNQVKMVAERGGKHG